MKIKTRYGFMEIIEGDEIASKSLKIYGEWAQNELDIFKDFIGLDDTVVDVGAYIGSHTMAFSNFVGPEGKVEAFEVFPQFYSILKENTKELKNVTTWNRGLASEPFYTKIEPKDLSNKENFGGSSFKDLQFQDIKTYDESVVSFRTLDELWLHYLVCPDFIKLDIEGMELDAIEGGSAVIDELRPIIFTEVNSITAGIELMQYMKSKNYFPFGVLTKAFNPKNYYRNLTNMFGNAKETGIMFFHKNSIDEWAAVIQNHHLPHLETYDDLAMIMFHKPQYPHEILAKTNTFEHLGFPK